jgi:hypothetical protein
MEVALSEAHRGNESNPYRRWQCLRERAC